LSFIRIGRVLRADTPVRLIMFIRLIWVMRVIRIIRVIMIF